MLTEICSYMKVNHILYVKHRKAVHRIVRLKCILISSSPTEYKPLKTMNCLYACLVYTQICHTTEDYTNNPYHTAQMLPNFTTADSIS